LVELEKHMKRLAIAFASTLAVALPISAQDGPAALVIRVQGSVSVTHGDGDPAPAAVGEPMFVGDQVIPGSGARAILITRAGAQQVVTENTTVAAAAGGAQTDIFARAMSTLAQAASADATLGGDQGMIRPIEGATISVSPRNDINLASVRPTFVWTATPGVTKYDLMLRNVDGGRPQIFELGADTTWTMPETAAELEYGATYAWHVFAGGRMGGRPTQEQTFRVHSLEESVELEDYLEEISVFGLDPMGDGLFLTVVAYRDLGLFYDARLALEEVERVASLSADLYMLKGEILDTLGHSEEARTAFDRASELMR
jgi:hypothetical protein